eukprot:scaffold20399_cov60-Phaeocystis_antarctica.AAC.5
MCLALTRHEAKTGSGAVSVLPPRLESRPLTVADEAVVVLGGDAAQARDHRGVSRCRELAN